MMGNHFGAMNTSVASAELDTGGYNTGVPLEKEAEVVQNKFMNVESSIETL